MAKPILSSSTSLIFNFSKRSFKPSQEVRDILAKPYFAIIRLSPINFTQSEIIPIVAISKSGSIIFVIFFCSCSKKVLANAIANFNAIADPDRLFSSMFFEV